MYRPTKEGFREFPTIEARTLEITEDWETIKSLVFDASVKPLYIEKAIFYLLSGKLEIYGAKFKVEPTGMIKMLIKPSATLKTLKVQNITILKNKTAALPMLMRGAEVVSFSGTQTDLLQFIYNLLNLFLKGKVLIDADITVNAFRLAKTVHIKAEVGVKKVEWKLF